MKTSRVKMQRRAAWLMPAGLIACGWLLYPRQTVYAFPEFLGCFQARYQAAYPQIVGSKLTVNAPATCAPPAVPPQNCALMCHRNGVGSEDNLTRYGLDFYRKHVLQGLSIDAAFAALEGADSDHDGWTNLQEIAAVTFPGDPTDHPRSGSTVTSSVAVISDEGAGTVESTTSSVVNTGTGTGVSAQPLDGGGGAPVTLTFTDVTQPGDTSLATSATGPAPPGGFQLGTPALYYEVTTTAAYTGSITICIHYANAMFTDTANLHLLHYESGAWVDVTTSNDTANQVICGSVASLSPFLIAQLTDFTPPVLTLPGDAVLEATGPGGAVATFSATAVDDIDGARPVTCAPVSGSTFALGTTTVICSASDTRGNTASGSFTITVRDTTPPVLTLPGSLILEATSPTGAAATFDAAAVDIVDGALPVACTPPSGATFPLGTTTVTCSSSDRRANTASGGFPVLVRDTTPPMAACTPVVLPGDKDADDHDDGAPGGLYRVTGSDAVGPLRLAIGPYALASGAVIKLAVTRQPGVVEIAKTTPSGIRRFRVGAADAFILARDGAGNSANALCPLGRDRDGDDDHERHDKR